MIQLKKNQEENNYNTFSVIQNIHERKILELLKLRLLVDVTN